MQIAGVAKITRQILKRGGSRVPALVRAASETLALARSFRRGPVGTSYLVFVVLPTLLYFVYAALWQTRYYKAETRMIVTIGTQLVQPPPTLGVGDPNANANANANAVGSQGASSSASSAPSASAATIQDGFIVLNYIKSAAMLKALGGASYFEEKFGAGAADFFSRVAKRASIEEMTAYWLSHINASVDIVSGILTVQVFAYRPQDALAISKDLIRLSEALLNEMTARQRKDRLADAEREVASYADKLAKERANTTLFREENALIDPLARARSISDSISKLTMEKINIENSLATLKGIVDPSSPTQKIQRIKLESIEQQIASLKSSLTDARGANTAASQIAAYERLQLDEQFAASMYALAQNTYQMARLDLEKQQSYLSVISTPVLPQAPYGPRVFAGSLVLLITLKMLWTIAALLVVSVSDHIA